MRRRANQPDHSAFHVRQKDVLLGLVKAVNFINKENGWLTLGFEPVGSRRENTAHVRHVRLDAAQTLEFAPGMPSDDLRQGSFSGTRRTKQYQGLNTIGLDGAAKQLTRSKDMRLAYEFIEISRAHPCRQRPVAERLLLGLARRAFGRGGAGKEVI